MATPHTPTETSGRRIHVVATRIVHRTILSVVDHNTLNIAQSTAYAAILALFPALIVAAAAIGLLPDNAPLRFQLSGFFDRILPPDVSPMLDAYFQSRPSNIHSARALLTAGFLSVAGASNVIVTLMEGLRRAEHLPERCWSFWERRRRSLLLVFLSLIPLACASVLVVFGHAFTVWITPEIAPFGRMTFFAVAFVVRWIVTLSASVGLIALIYKLGLPPQAYRPAMQPTWMRALPGAFVATAMWFLTTLAFGWYVTRYANYSEIYGSLGAGIALLFWLYIISLSVLCGAEFNANCHSILQLESPRQEPSKADSPQRQTTASQPDSIDAKD